MTLKELNELLEIIKKYGHIKSISTTTPIGELKEKMELAGIIC